MTGEEYRELWEEVSPALREELGLNCPSWQNAMADFEALEANLLTDEEPERIAQVATEPLEEDGQQAAIVANSPETRQFLDRKIDLTMLIGVAAASVFLCLLIMVPQKYLPDVSVVSIATEGTIAGEDTGTFASYENLSISVEESAVNLTVDYHIYNVVNPREIDQLIAMLVHEKSNAVVASDLFYHGIPGYRPGETGAGIAHLSFKNREQGEYTLYLVKVAAATKERAIDHAVNERGGWPVEAARLKKTR
ncbi:hypothetical protein KQI84_02880 [bacterium]|nr:hypothetical protein [bacterium]